MDITPLILGLLALVAIPVAFLLAILAGVGLILSVFVDGSRTFLRP